MKKLVLVVLTTVFASASFAGSKGTVSIYNIQADPQTKVIAISGDAAEELYNSYSDENIVMLEHNRDNKTVQKLGRDITCNHTTVYARTAKAKDTNSYRCELSIKDSVIQAGAAG